MRRGRFEQADGGTLFLDEIGDMPFDLQTRLLRVLSDGHFYRVGGHNAVKANVRVIAATHQDLEQRVKEGGFREDLFHRLNVIRLRLPALRERLEDIPMLTRHFLQQSAKQLGVEPKRISDAALARLASFGFPGQRAPAGEHLPLADRDGAGAADRSQGPAARSGGAACGRRPRRAAAAAPAEAARLRRRRRRPRLPRAGWRRSCRAPSCRRRRPRAGRRGLEAEAMELLPAAATTSGTS